MLEEYIKLEKWTFLDMWTCVRFTVPPWKDWNNYPSLESI